MGEKNAALLSTDGTGIAGVTGGDTVSPASPASPASLCPAACAAAPAASHAPRAAARGAHPLLPLPLLPSPQGLKAAVHSVDTVLLPALPSHKTIGDAFKANMPHVATFISALQAIGEFPLASNYQGTLLLPTEEALAAFLSARGLTAKQLLHDKPLMRTLVYYHMTPKVHATIASFAPTATIATRLSDTPKLLAATGRCGAARCAPTARRPTPWAAPPGHAVAGVLAPAVPEPLACPLPRRAAWAPSASRASSAAPTSSLTTR